MIPLHWSRPTAIAHSFSAAAISAIGMSVLWYISDITGEKLKWYFWLLGPVGVLCAFVGVVTTYRYLTNAKAGFGEQTTLKDTIEPYDKQLSKSAQSLVAIVFLLIVGAFLYYLISNFGILSV